MGKGKAEADERGGTNPHDRGPEFVLLVEYGLGGEIDGDRLDYREGCSHNTPGSGIMQDHLPLLAAERIGNGFRHWVRDPSPEKIRAGLDLGFPGAMIDVWNPAAYARAAAKRGKLVREFVDKMVDLCRELVKEHPGCIWVNTLPEYDNAQWDDYAGQPADRAEAFQRLRSLYVDNHGLNMFPPPDAPGEQPFPSDVTVAECIEALSERVKQRGEAYRSPFSYFEERGIKPEEINLVTLCCQTFSPHLLYELGVQAVWPEGNVGNNHQLTIAFVRGAARQYGRSWCYDVAPFTIKIPMGYDTRRRQVAGFSESYMLRAWIVSFLSGARTFLLQACDMGFFTRRKDGKLELSPLGELGKEFSDFTLRRHPDRGRTRAPIGLLLAQDHGYTTPYRNSPRLFGGHLPDDRANRSIEGFFRLAFPGFYKVDGTACVDRSLWAPGGSWDRQFPWLTPDTPDVESFGMAFRTALRDGTFDKQYSERGMLTESTWGDSFDVLVDNAPGDVLRDYPALILLGSIKVDDSLRTRLKAYVEGGGRVLLNVSQVSEADEAWLGVRFKGPAEPQFIHTHSLLTKRVFTGGPFSCVPVEPGQETECLIKAGFTGQDGEAVLTRHRLGKGDVWLVTVPDYLPTPEKLDITWFEACKEAVDEFIRPHLALAVDGPPLEWLVNDHDDGRLWAGLFNNSDQAWAGMVRVQDDLGRAACRDIWNEKPVRFEYDDSGRVALKPEIAPWSFLIVEVTPSPGRG